MIFKFKFSEIYVIILLSFCFPILPKCLLAQEAAWRNDIPNPISPQAYEFAKYGDIPVGKYTGTNGFQIPLYSISAAGLEIPIFLSYHSNGIKVSEEASWVGLGWSLSAGGSIVQVVNEYDDFGINSPRNWVDSSIYNIPYGINCLGSLGVVNLVEAPPMTPSLGDLDQSINDKIDMEPDIFRFNFLNYSGEFLFDKNQQKFICLGNTNLRITSDIETSGVFLPQIFVITVPDGHKFHFKLMTKTNIDESYGWMADSGGNSAGTSSPVHVKDQASSRLYELFLIYTSKGESIYFEYEISASIQNYPSISQTQIYNERTSVTNPGPDVLKLFPTYRTIVNYSMSSQPLTYLKEIVTDKVRIIFSSSLTRDDITGARKLDKITVEDNSISSYQGKVFNFSYDYFLGTNIGNTMDQDLIDNGIIKSISEKNNRLRLNSVEEVGLGKYEFLYDPTPLPSKTSFAYDDWGNYNGYLQSSVMDRGPVNVNYAKASILTEVVYPLSGKTKFEYEMNEISDQIVTNPIYVPESGKVQAFDQNYGSGYNDTYGVSAYKVSPTSFWLVVPEKSHVIINPILSLTGTCSSNPGNELYYPNATWEIRSYNAAAKDMVLANGWSTIPSFVSNSSYLLNVETGKIKVGDPLYKDWGRMKRILPPGVYYFNAGLNDVCGPQNTVGQYGFAYISLEYQQNRIDHYETSTPKGAGLRIKSIKNFNEFNFLVGTKSFYYFAPVLMSPPVKSYITDFQTEYLANYDPCLAYFEIVGRSHQKSSQPILAPSNNASGKNVGYGRVEELQMDIKNETSSNGKVITYFSNESDRMLYDPSYPSWKPNRDNGLVLKEYFISSLGDTIAATLNEYEDRVLPCYHTFRSRWKRRLIIGDSGVGAGQCIPIYGNEYWVGYFPITRTQTFMKSRKNIVYASSAKLVKQENFQYDTFNQLANHKILESNGAISEVVMKYPYNSSVVSNVFNEMLKENAISNVVELEKRLNGKLLYHEVNFYKVIDSTILYGKRQYFDKYITKNRYHTNDSLRTLVRFSLYNKNRLMEYVDNKGITSCLLWGYEKNYLVGKIQNVNYSSVQSIINQEILDHPVDDQTLRNEVNRIRTYFPNAIVESYTHWPLKGLTSVTDANSVTIFYEYDQLGRLILTRDMNGDILSRYQYEIRK